MIMTGEESTWDRHEPSSAMTCRQYYRPTLPLIVRLASAAHLHTHTEASDPNFHPILFFGVTTKLHVFENTNTIN